VGFFGESRDLFNLFAWLACNDFERLLSITDYLLFLKKHFPETCDFHKSHIDVVVFQIMSLDYNSGSAISLANYVEDIASQIR
jgi:hypothetical protein